MKNLVQKVAIPLILIGTMLSGCVTIHSNKPIKLVDGFSAESKLVNKKLKLIALFSSGQVTLEKTDKGYIGKRTGLYLETLEMFNFFYNQACRLADGDKDKNVTKSEANNGLDEVYRLQSGDVQTIEEFYLSQSR